MEYLATEKPTLTDAEWRATLKETERGLVVAKARITAISTGRVLLLRRSSDPSIVHTRRGEWDTAGGFVEAGEDETIACMREIWEETGKRVHGVIEIADPQQVVDSLGRNLDMRFYEAMVAEEFEPELCAEHDAYIWVELKEAHRMLGTALVRIDG